MARAIRSALLSVIASLTAFGALAQAPPSVTAPAALSCNVFPGWWESTNLAPVFPGSNSVQQPKPNDCDFQVWSWTAFVNWMQTDPATGQPRFLALPTPADLQSPNPLVATVRQRTLTLRPRTEKPKSISSVDQAFGGAMIDQNSRALYYATHMDPIYFATTQQYYGPTNYQKATPTTQYPSGATVFKTAWRIVPPGQTVNDTYTTSATIELMESDGQGGLKPNGQTAPATVALVGVHVVGVVADHPEFLWATFEQVDNAPDLPAGMAPNSPQAVSNRDFTFYKAGTSARDSNQIAQLTIDVATQKISPVTSVFRQAAFGGATPSSRVADIQAVNGNFRSMIAGGSVKSVPQVFTNYKLIGTVWLLADTLQPGDGNLDREAIGSVTLMNSTMETFVQNFSTPNNPSNCFSCHNTSARKPYPGKDVNLSHILLGSLPRQAGVLESR